MYYRITKVTHKPGVQDQIRDYLKSKEDLMKAIVGLQSVTLIEIDETSSMGISLYENEQQIINADRRTPSFDHFFHLPNLSP